RPGDEVRGAARGIGQDQLDRTFRPAPALRPRRPGYAARQGRRAELQKFTPTHHSLVQDPAVYQSLRRPPASGLSFELDVGRLDDLVVAGNVLDEMLAHLFRRL